MRQRAATVILTLAIASTAMAAASAATVGGPSHNHPNLLRNGDGAVGAYSVQGWDSVTIPVWRVVRGLPTVVRYGTPHFPTAAHAHATRRLFAGGPGGPAVLSESISLRSRSGGLPPSGARYRISGWLGGTHTSEASLRATFLSASGRVLQRRTIGPVGRRHRATLLMRSAAGMVPRGAAEALITLRLTTSLTNYDGPNAPQAGYNRAVAGDLTFTLSNVFRAPPRVRPPVARVPRFDHVFLFMFENQDYRTVVGNRKQAPYFNSLVPRGTLLANAFAEAHPSDANYLAIAGGSALGIPPTNPLESNPLFSIHARNIGDLVGAAHETWRAYLQSAAGPCDDTVHGYYWNDDLPFLYFPRIRDRPAYCARHVVPLEAMRSDLARARTTPSFSWIAADDCSDMEGCGLHKGDQFLAQTLGRIMRSRAWRTQRSLAIITMDEDAYNHEHPPQLVPTLVLGSRAVRQGYVSHVRYTHYSLLRTIEAALRLRTLTGNDRYAQAVNDAFNARALDRSSLAPPQGGATRGQAGAPGSAGAAIPRGGAPVRHIALVANYGSDTVTPVSLSTAKAGKAIPVGSGPDAIALTPDDRTAYVANSGSGTVTPINTATLKAGPSIHVGSDPTALVVSPDGRTAYVANSGSGTVTPINTATNQPERAIRVGAFPRSIAVVPGGRKAYVLDWGAGSITPINLLKETAGRPIRVGSYPSAIAFSPHGAVAYVASYGSSTVTPINTATDHASRAVAVAQTPNALAVAPDGRRLMVVSGDRSSVTVIDVGTGRAQRRSRVGYSPEAIAFATGTSTAWVVSTIAGTVTPTSAYSDRVGKPLSVGIYSYPTSITFAPGSLRAVVLDTYAGKVSLVNTRTRAVRTVKVGGYPGAVAITR